MCMCDPFGVGGGGGSLLSAGGSFSTRPPAVTTSCVSSGDKNKNIPYQQVPFGLTRLLLHAYTSETRAKTFFSLFLVPSSLLCITTQTDASPTAILPKDDNLLVNLSVVHYECHTPYLLPYVHLLYQILPPTIYHDSSLYAIR